MTNSAVVPTAQFKTGVFNYDGQQINLANRGSANNALGLPLDPTMQKVLALFPNPNGPALDSIRGIYFFPTSTPQDTANVTFRLDQHFSEKYTLSARYRTDFSFTTSSGVPTISSLGCVGWATATPNFAGLEPGIWVIT